MKSPTCARSRASGSSAWSPSRREVGERLVLAREDLQHLVGLAQRRVRAVDDLVQLGAAAGQRGAELVDQEREPLAVGQPHDVVDQVEVDRRARPLERQHVPGPRRPRRPGSPRAPGWSELPGSHSTNFSPISDCGRIVQRGVLRGRARSPSSSIRRTTTAFLSSVTSSDSIAPTLRPGDLDVLALDRAGDVVEDRADLVAGAVVVGRADAEHERGHGARRSRRAMAKIRLMGPVARSRDRSRRCRRCRATGPSRRAAAAWRRPDSGRTGSSRGPRGASRSASGVSTCPSSGADVIENGLNIGWMRAKWPWAS